MKKTPYTNSRNGGDIMYGDKVVSKRGKIVINIAISVGLLITWTAFTYFGYTYSKDYFDRSLNELDLKYSRGFEEISSEVDELKRESNLIKSQIDVLNGNVQKLNSSIDRIFENVTTIDTVIRETTDLQDVTNNRLSELDKRLNELIKNLEILRKAP